MMMNLCTMFTQIHHRKVMSIGIDTGMDLRYRYGYRYGYKYGYGYGYGGNDEY